MKDENESGGAVVEKRFLKIKLPWTGIFRVLILLMFAFLGWVLRSGPGQVIAMITPTINAAVTNSIPYVVEQSAQGAARYLEPVIERKTEIIAVRVMESVRRDFVESRIYELKQEQLKGALAREEGDRKSEDSRINDTLREIRSEQRILNTVIQDIARAVGAKARTPSDP